MNRDQIIKIGLVPLAEMGLIELKKPAPEKNQIGTVALWKMATSDLTDAELKSGFDGLIANSTSDFNKRILPGDLRQYVNKHTAVNHGQMFDEILEKGHFMKYPEFRDGQWIIQSWSSPLIPKAIAQMGGLDLFLSLEQDQMNTFRSQFRDIVNALNESEQNKAIVKPILDARQVLGQSQTQARPMLQAAKQEPEEHKPDPRVVESFAALRARFEQRKMEAQTAKHQAMQSAANSMAQAMEAFK